MTQANESFEPSNPQTLLLCLSASDVVSLGGGGGGGGLAFRLNPEPGRTHGDVLSVAFKTLRNSGIVLQAAGGDGPGLSLELHGGRLQLLLRQGVCVCVCEAACTRVCARTHLW